MLIVDRGICLIAVEYIIGGVIFTGYIVVKVVVLVTI